MSPIEIIILHSKFKPMIQLFYLNLHKLQNHLYISVPKIIEYHSPSQSFLNTTLVYSYKECIFCVVSAKELLELLDQYTYTCRLTVYVALNIIIFCTVHIILYCVYW